MNTVWEDLPLGSRTIIRTSNREEALQFATEAVADMRVDYRRPDSHFEYHLAGEQLGTLDVMAMELHIGGGADMNVFGVDDAYVIEFPILGQSSAAVGNDQKAIASGQYALIHGPHDHVTWHDEGFRYRALSLKVSGAVLRKRLSQFAGLDTSREISFSPFIDLQTSGARSVAAILRTAVELLEQRDSVLSTPANSVLFEEFVANSLLTVLPSSVTSLLEQPVLTTNAASLRRVEDFVEAHLDTPITVADLAEIAGLSVRSLQRAFQERFNVSPLRYIRDRRLERARVRLMAAEGLETVSQIAFATGFTHLGAFGAEYKRRFGETPSETLARKKI